jgi:hypothetical protein
MFSIIKSILKSLELFLNIKNNKFYYDLHKEHQQTEVKLINEIEKLRQNGTSDDADRADLLRQQLADERKQFKHLSTFYSKTGQGASNTD